MQIKIRIQSKEWDYGRERWRQWEGIVVVDRDHEHYQDDFYWMELGLPIYKKDFAAWYRKAR